MRIDICTVDDVRDYFLGPPYGTAPIADTTKGAPLTAAKTFKRKRIGLQTCFILRE